MIYVRQPLCFNTASGMDCMQCRASRCGAGTFLASIPQAVWIACNLVENEHMAAHAAFQYRKRYGLHAIRRRCSGHLRVFPFQYRKRYGLHAIISSRHVQWHRAGVSIPQAVWIACNMKKKFRSPSRPSFQYRKRYGLHAIIPFQNENAGTHGFQYRKRYGLHAIPSLTALGTAEPRSGFSKRIALLDRSPQPRGIFLSPKSAENVRKPCNIKETFVHGKNLKLMAFSPKSLPSL